MSVLTDIAEEEFEMEMTPMIDVTFLLLIFFLLTLKFKTLEGKLSAYLPKDVGVNSSDAEPKEKVEIKVEVIKAGEKRDPNDLRKEWSGEGRFEYVGREQRYYVGPQRTTQLDELGKKLSRLYKADKERPATLNGLPGTTYGDLVPVLDVALEVGFTDITFSGEIKQTKK